MPAPPRNVLDVRDRLSFRAWLSENSGTESECWVRLRRGRPSEDGCFYYIDAVEEALCFGWIDSTQRSVDGRMMQRFSPRRRGSGWTELNKERVRRLERLGLMTDAGRAVLPDMDPDSFTIPEEIENALRDAGAWDTFGSFPALYRRVRVHNVLFYKKKDESEYRRALSRLVEMTASGKMYGEWNDYGRLL